MKRALLLIYLLVMLFALTGCLIQPDPTLEPITITEGVVPFGTVQPLPTDAPTPSPTPTPTKTPDNWQASDQSTWEDWTKDTINEVTPRPMVTADPNAQSWQTSTQDYNAGYPVLRVGSVGADVADLQARLTELSYYTGVIDGHYGLGTQTAVMEFQQRHGIAADGVAGRQTQDTLYSLSAQPKFVTVDSAAQATYSLLKLGASGLEVRKLQARLAELGYYAGGADGKYG